MDGSAADFSALSAMISPALFLTATGSLIISTSNRMSRIADRLRTMAEQADKIDRGHTELDFPEQRLRHVSDQLERLVWRSDRVRAALSMLYAALATFVGTSLTLAVDVLLNHIFGALPTTLAVAGVTLMFASSLELVREAWASVRSNRSEVDFFRELMETRRQARDLSQSTAHSGHNATG